jgi:hypothetical protein
VLTYAITNRAECSSARHHRILIAYEQQRAWREIWMDGRALPKAVDVKGAPESRYYGYSVGHWENDNTLVIDTTAWTNVVAGCGRTPAQLHGAISRSVTGVSISTISSSPSR